MSTSVTTSAASTPASRQSNAPGLAQKSAHGLAWTLGQAFGSKFFTLAQQIILARLLDKDEWGFVGLAYVVPIFVGILQQGGTRELLIKRQRHFALWANAAFWMSLVRGFLCTLLMLTLAPLANAFFSPPGTATPPDHKIFYLVTILALQTFIASFALVSEAKLQIDLRFKYLAWVGIVTVAVSVGLSILLALLHFGPYSYILPIPAVGLLRTVLMWIAAPPTVRLKFHLRRWKYMVGDSILLVLASLFFTIVMQGDYIILGHMYAAEKEVVGGYFWAYNLAAQTLTMLAWNAGTVLFPTFARITAEPARQKEAFLRAARSLTIIGLPICLWQAVLADSGVHFLFKPKWYPCIQILQLLSVAMSLQMIWYAVVNIITAQGRFATLVRLTFLYVIVFLTLVYTGARLGKGTGVALAINLFVLVAAPLGPYVALRPLGGRWKEILGIYLVPLLAGALAAAVAFRMDCLLAPATEARWYLVLRMMLATALMGMIYLPLVRWLDRDTWDDLWQHASRLYNGTAR